MSHSRRFFNDASFWNQPIAADARIDPQSRAWIELLKRDAAGPHFGINLNKYTIPVYEVDANTPRVKVGWADNGEDPLWHPGHHPSFDAQGVPLPPEVVPSPGEDAHVAVVDWGQKKAWDMWAVRKNEKGEWVSLSGMTYDLDGSGVFDRSEFPMVDEESVHFYGPSRAAGVPAIAGLIMHHEVIAGEIPHKLACALRYVGHKEFVYPPAIWTDGNYIGGVPEGATIQLDPHLDLSRFKLVPGALAVARAFQKYGAVVTDFAAANALYGEGLWSSKNKTWEGLLPEWSKDGGIAAIPLDHYRVLEAQPRFKGGDRIKEFMQKFLR